MHRPCRGELAARSRSRSRRLQRTAWLVACVLSALALACGDDAGGDRSDGGPGDAGGAAGRAALEGGIDRRDAAAIDASDPADAGRDTGAPDADVGADAMPGDAATDAGGLSINFAEYCPMLVDAVCEWWKACRAAQDCTAGPIGSVEAFCEAAPPLVESGALVFDQSRALPCLELHGVPESPSECTAFGPPPLLTGHGFGPAPAPNACTGLVRGTADLGEDCYPHDVPVFSDGCAEGYCLRADSACPGTCTAFAAEGDACGSGVRCGADLYCSQGRLRCERYRGSGQPCSAALDQRCGPDLDCDDVCVTRPGEGGICDALQCANGLSCGETGVPGAPRICAQPRGLGEPCAIDAGCFHPLLCIDSECSDALVGQGDRCVAHDNCAAGYTCQGADARSCELVRADGAECTASEECALGHDCTTIPSDSVRRCYALGAESDECGPRACDADLYCAPTGRCAPRIEEGDACEIAYSDCVAGLRCMDDGMCHPPGGVGEPCEGLDSLSCEEALFCDRATHTCAEPVLEDELCHPDDPTSCAAGLYCDCPQPCTVDGSMTQPEQRCRPQLANESVCMRSEECAGGLCDGVCRQALCRRPAQ